MNTIKKDKDEIRARYKEKRDTMDPSLRASRDKSICKTAVNLASFRHAKYVLMYAPIDGEIDVNPIALEALSKGKKVAFPRCNRENHTMKYHIVSSLEELVEDSYGILEPSESAPVFDPKLSVESICFVPGLCYDKKGYRLGYGKGFYDRYLSAFKGCIIGVVYSDFILPSVPKGRFDISLGVLLTEKGVKITGEI